MTPEEQKSFLAATGEYIRGEIEKACKSLRERIAQLEHVIAEWGYKGEWQDDVVYRNGNFVMLGGSMWFCLADRTTSRPHTGSSEWGLAVKRGRDGKSAEPRKPTTLRTIGSNNG